ncbi:MAG: TolC family protein, partial [Gemmataceae bacterium]
NVYRASLIQYHRARRSYMALADSIDQNLRRELRELKLARLSFETARQSLLSAARQLESAKIRVLSQEAQNSAGTSTLDILRAQDSLLNARNGLVGSYISYEQQRVQLFLDLEALQLDDQGRPRDESPSPAERSEPAEARPGSGDRKPSPPTTPPAPPSDREVLPQPRSARGPGSSGVLRVGVLPTNEVR